MAMRNGLTRRALIKAGILAGTFLPVADMVPGRAQAAELPNLNPADPTANAMGYVVKTPKPGQTCADCAQYSGKAHAATGTCELFPGKRVAATGWCSAYLKKPGA